MRGAGVSLGIGLAIACTDLGAQGSVPYPSNPRNYNDCSTAFQENARRIDHSVRAHETYCLRKHGPVTKGYSDCNDAARAKFQRLNLTNEQHRQACAEQVKQRGASGEARQ